MRHLLTPVRMAKMNNSGKQILLMMWTRGNPLALKVEMQPGAATLEAIWKLFKELKLGTPV